MGKLSTLALLTLRSIEVVAAHGQADPVRNRNGVAVGFVLGGPVGSARYLVVSLVATPFVVVGPAEGHELVASEVVVAGNGNTHILVREGAGWAGRGHAVRAFRPNAGFLGH